MEYLTAAESLAGRVPFGSLVDIFLGVVGVGITAFVPAAVPHNEMWGGVWSEIELYDSKNAEPALDHISRSNITGTELWRVTQDITVAKTAISSMHANAAKLSTGIIAHPVQCDGLEKLSSSFEHALTTSNNSLTALNKNFLNFMNLLAGHAGILEGEIKQHLRNWPTMGMVERLGYRYCDYWGQLVPRYYTESSVGRLTRSVDDISTCHLDMVKVLSDDPWDLTGINYINPLDHFTRQFQSLVGVASIDSCGLDMEIVGVLAKQQIRALDEYQTAEKHVRQDLRAAGVQLRDLYRDVRLIARMGAAADRDDPLPHLQDIALRISRLEPVREDATQT